MGAAGGGEDLPQQQSQAFGIDAHQCIGRAGQVNRALDREPLPAGPEHDGGQRSRSQVAELGGATLGDEPDHRRTGDGMVEHARIDDRRLN